MLRLIKNSLAISLAMIAQNWLLESAFAQTNSGFPKLSSLLIDESSRDVYVLPAEVAKSGALPFRTEGFVLKPGVPYPAALVSTEKINSFDTPLAERLGIFSFAVQKKVGRMQLDANWARALVTFVNNAHRFAATSDIKDSLWPLSIPYSMSPLLSENGFVLVFTCKSADKAGTLQKIDLARFMNGTVIRSYWSRSFNDPLQIESTSAALDKAVAHFARSLSNSKPVVFQEGKLRIAVDRKVPEKELSTIERAIKGLLQEESDTILIPYEVSKNDIRYQTPLPANLLPRLEAKVSELSPRLSFRQISAESNVVQIKLNAR